MWEKRANQSHMELSVYLVEHRVKTGNEATDVADELGLIHKNHFSGSSRSYQFKLLRLVVLMSHFYLMSERVV